MEGNGSGSCWQTLNVVSFAAGREDCATNESSSNIVRKVDLKENAEVQSHEQSTHNANFGARDLSHNTPTHKGLGTIDSQALQKSVNKMILAAFKRGK
jgi:hypothetical protein